MIAEHGSEPVLGLPGPLPAGERLLWQGRPDWKALGLRAYRVRAVSIYFGLLLAWRGVTTVYDGGTLGDALVNMAWLLPLALSAVLILGLLAWLGARATVYSVTDRRVVIRCGVALPMAVNLPYAIVGSAAVKTFRDGTGDLPLKPVKGARVSYVALWPHVRPWKFGWPEPALRAVPDAAHVAGLLGQALAAAAEARPAAEMVAETKPAAAVQATPSRPAPTGALLGGAGA